MGVADFIWKVALPREFAINAVVNGAIAYLLFWHRVDVPLTGWSGLASMLVPMSFLLPWLTSFFGVASFAWNPSVQQESLKISRDLDKPIPEKLTPWKWGSYAIGLAFVHAFISFGTTLLVLQTIDSAGLSPRLTGWGSVLSIAIGSGLAACFFHRRSILKANQAFLRTFLRA